MYDKKWFRFLKKTWLFRYIPFVEMAFGSGSLAVGNVDEESDFDVLIGVREGRIFTARFCAALLFGVFGWRRSKLDHSVAASDKICLNHFMTPQTYRFQLEYNEYWKMMYQGLAPIYGSDEKVKAFFDANRGWVGDFTYEGDLRHLHKTSALKKRFFESLLAGNFGDWVEKKLKAYQIQRIERGLPQEQQGKAPRIIRVSGSAPAQVDLPPLIKYTDTELEFHPDPVRIEIV